MSESGPVTKFSTLPENDKYKSIYPIGADFWRTGIHHDYYGNELSEAPTKYYYKPKNLKRGIQETEPEDVDEVVKQLTYHPLYQWKVDKFDKFHLECFALSNTNYLKEIIWIRQLWRRCYLNQKITDETNIYKFD